MKESVQKVYKCEYCNKLYDSDLKADELQAKIDQFLSDNCHGYRKNISVLEIERI